MNKYNRKYRHTTNIYNLQKWKNITILNCCLLLFLLVIFAARRSNISLAIAAILCCCCCFVGPLLLVASKFLQQLGIFRYVVKRIIDCFFSILCIVGLRCWREDGVGSPERILIIIIIGAFLKNKQIRSLKINLKIKLTHLTDSVVLFIIVGRPIQILLAPFSLPFEWLLWFICKQIHASRQQVLVHPALILIIFGLISKSKATKWLTDPFERRRTILLKMDGEFSTI